MSSGNYSSAPGSDASDNALTAMDTSETVSFMDSRGRTCLVKLNTSQQLDLYINGQHSAQNLSNFAAQGDRLSFVGQRQSAIQATLTVAGTAQGVLRRISAIIPPDLEERVLPLLKNGVIRILDVDWLLEMPEDYIICRRQDLPDEAFLPPAAAAILLDSARFVVLSYSWLTKQHPDPEGFHFRKIRHYLDSHRERIVASTMSLKHEHFHKTGMFWDFASLPQKGPDGKRTPEEKEIFKRGLGAMAHLYGSKNTTVLLQKAQPEGMETPYDDRGWCLFEATVSNILKHATLRVEISGEDAKEADRASLLHPSTMSNRLRKKVFTNGKNERHFVAQKYEEFFYQAAGTVKILWFDNHSSGWDDEERPSGWDDEEMMELSKCLPHYVQGERLLLARNQFSDEGLSWVLEILPRLKHMMVLNLDGCTNISGMSFQALVECPMPSMRILGLRGTALKDDGLAMVASSLPSFPGLKVLCLAECVGIGSPGFSALARQLPEGLEELYLGESALDDERMQSLLEKLPALQQLRRLDFRGCRSLGPSSLTGLAGCLPQLPTMVDYEACTRCPAGHDISTVLPASFNLLSCFRCGQFMKQGDDFKQGDEFACCFHCQYAVCKLCIWGALWLPPHLLDTPEGSDLTTAWASGEREEKQLRWC